jgi:hypothetical protein
LDLDDDYTDLVCYRETILASPSGSEQLAFNQLGGSLVSAGNAGSSLSIMPHGVTKA